jgi:hypothetical protein
MPSNNFWRPLALAVIDLSIIVIKGETIPAARMPDTT